MTEVNKKALKGATFTKEQADRTRDFFSTAISYITIEDDSIRPRKPEHVFYMHFIQALRYMETNDTPLAAVQFTPKSATGNLYINPKNASNLPLRQFAGLIVHELLHIVFGHVHIESEERKRYPKHCNVAMDMAINQIVLQDQYKLPWGKEIFDDHPEIEVEPCLPETVAKKINEKLLALGEEPVAVPAANESYEFYLVWLFDALKKLKEASENNEDSSCSSCGGTGIQNSEKSEESDKSDKSNESEESDSSDKSDKSDKSQKSDKSDESEELEESEKSEESDKSNESNELINSEESEESTSHEHNQKGKPCPDCTGSGSSSRDIADQLLDELDDQTDHDSWESSEELTDEERELVKRFVAQAAQEAANSSGGVGNLPGAVQAAYKNLIKVLEPKMDWSDKIREFTGGCGSLTGYVRTMRENKHGLPGLYSFRPNMSVGLVVDTSGSVSEQEFGLFMAEAIAIAKTYDIEVYVLETSYGPTNEVWSISEVGVQEMYQRVGYGGTNMRPGIDKYLELNEDKTQSISVGGIIVLSDGELGLDSIITPEEIDIPLLWAFTRDVDPFKNKRYAGEIMYFDPHNKQNAKVKASV
jgi:predicted metal-dependent peptidase